MASLSSSPMKATTGHGSGGRLTQQLTRRILDIFQPNMFQMGDCAFIGGDMAISTDGFTVFPHDFPGGDIGKLAVCGSANDLAVRGARPLFLTLALIIEEGLDLADLDRYMGSAARAAGEGGIQLVAGDTKVVPHGAADKLFITTCAVGKRESPHVLQTSNLREGDILILSTSPGRHGAALAAARFGLSAPELLSDCALLWRALKPLWDFSELRWRRLWVLRSKRRLSPPTGRSTPFATSWGSIACTWRRRAVFSLPPRPNARRNVWPSFTEAPCAGTRRSSAV